ncbi:unnamed protein product [Oikopleura dioica]|uniref:Uncharacterized protein n=1 Tax=Oikopleura dioica TaxID=34765 RepID=E4XYZ3_OIKDI|nr:unnamed protein product [Oikopleura dioica]
MSNDVLGLANIGRIIEHDFDVLSFLNQKSWSRERAYGRNIGNIGEAEHLFSDPDQRNSLIPIEGGDKPDYDRGFNWKWNNIKQFNEVFRTRQTAQDFASGLVLVSGEFKNLKIGMSRRCEFAMSVPSGSFVTDISVHRFFREFFKAVDVYVEEANRKMAPGMLAIDSDARVFCKRAALADFCRWGTLPTRRLVSLFELIPDYSFETYRVNELSNRNRYCLTHYGLGGELALVIYAFMVRKLLLENGLSYDPQVHAQKLGTAPISSGMPNHRAPFHNRRRETDPEDISEEKLERRAFIAFRCTTEDLAYTGSAGRAAYQFLLQTVGRVGVHLREVADDAGLLGQVVETRLDPRVWACFSADSFLALAKYFYTSAAEHYYCGSDEMMFCTLQLVYWVYTQTRRRQDVVLFGAYPLLNRYIKQMEILRPLGQERSVWVGGINCPKPTKDVYAFNR